MLQRTQLVLDDKLRLELAVLARDESRSVSDLAREMLWEKIKEKQAKAKKAKKITAVDSMGEMVKASEKLALFDHGPRDLSKNHDKYIY